MDAGCPPFIHHVVVRSHLSLLNMSLSGLDVGLLLGSHRRLDATFAPPLGFQSLELRVSQEPKGKLWESEPVARRPKRPEL